MKNFTLFSMGLYKLNMQAGIIIIILALSCFLAAFFKKGIIVGAIGLVTFSADIFFLTHMNTGIPGFDSIFNQITPIIGEYITPGIGFMILAVSSLLMVVSGVMMSLVKKWVGLSGKTAQNEHFDKRYNKRRTGKTDCRLK